jgi:hypothetical protein
MAKKEVSPKAEATEPKEAPKPKKPIVPISAKELPKIISERHDDIPDCLTVDYVKQLVTIEFDGDVPNVFNTLNEYTDELRKTFQAAGLAKWKAFFMANGGKFVSTL